MIGFNKYNSCIFKPFLCKSEKISTLCLVLFCSFLLPFICGCDNGAGSFSSTSGKTSFESSGIEPIFIDKKVDVCRIGDNVSLAVTCRDSGGALLRDIEVRFTSEQGTFSDKTLKTDDRGSVSVEFVPAKTGTNYITVSADGKQNQTVLQVFPKELNPKGCFINVSSTIIKPEGKVIVQVVVYDESNFATIKDAKVTLQCEHGKLESDSGQTDEEGSFITLYTASKDVGPDKIRAVSLGASSEIVITVQEE